MYKLHLTGRELEIVVETTRAYTEAVKRDPESIVSAESAGDVEKLLADVGAIEAKVGALLRYVWAREHVLDCQNRLYFMTKYGVGRYRQKYEGGADNE